METENAAGTTETQARRRPWWWTVSTSIAVRVALSAGGLLCGLLLLGIAEGAIRWVAPRPPAQDLVEYVSALPGFAVPCDAADRLGPRQAGALRLAVVGESSGEMLSAAIAAHAGSASIRLAACAQTGSGIEQIEARFDGVVGADPDAVVIVAGHNLLILSATGIEAAVLALRAKSHLLSWLPFSRAYEPRQYPLRLERFEKFLRHAAAASRKHGFRLVLVTMTPNYWVPPLDWKRANDIGRQAMYTARFLRWAGRSTEAEEILLALSPSSSPEVEFELGLSLRLSGRWREARIHLERVLMATMTTRAISSTNALIRRVAAEEQLLLRDSLGEAEARASDGIPGWETVSDHCHLLAAAFARDAQEILRMLGVATNAKDSKPAANPEPRQPESLEGGVVAGQSVPSRIERLNQIFLSALAGERQPTGGYRPDAATDATLAVIDWRLLTEGGAAERVALDRLLDNLPPSWPANVRARAFVAAAEAFAYMKDWRTARTLNAKARSLDASSSLAWIQAGLLEVANGTREGALASFRRALELEPTRLDAQVYIDLLRSEYGVGDLAHFSLPK